MFDSIQSLLDAFPDGVVQAREGRILAANAMARQYLPQLAPGDPLPDWFPPSGGDGAGKGVFSVGSRPYRFSCMSSGEDLVILFRPDVQSGLEDWQLDGVLQQLRTLLGELLAEVGPAAVPGGQVSAGAFSKTFHRLFRLMENLDFMRQTSAGGIGFHPVTMDLAGLCRDIVRPAEDLLREAGVTLEYRSKLGGLLIPGDPALLRRLLLGLISNAAKAAGDGTVTLTLRRSGSWAVLLVSNSGPVPTPQQLSALLREGPGDALPLPGQGAGLGIPIARHIVALHRGRLLVQGGGGAPSVLAALPTGPLDGRTSVRTPALFQQDGGLDPVLMELSDVLPAHLFAMEGLD